MSSLPHDAGFKHQPPRSSGEHSPLVSNDPHVRIPVPAREQSTLESLSSAFRGIGGMTRATTQQSRTTTHALFSPHAAFLTSPGPGSNLMLSDDDGGPEEGIYARFPAGALDHDAIIWSGWDEIVWGDHSSPSRLLLLGYTRGFQVWDCSTERVREVLNLLSPTIGTVVNAAVLPFPTVALDDSLAEERPLLGILTSNPDELIIYSLRTHTVIKQIPFNSPKAIQASDRFLVISTISPPTLHVLDAAAFNIIHTITAPKLALPIFSLSRRLLAYASTPPPPSASPTPTAASQSPSKVQADISMALEGARKVGAGVWSGVKTLLGDSAASRSPASPLTRSPAPMSPTSRTLLGTPRMYSRSAPADSTCSTPTPSPRIALPTTGETRLISSQGHVTVLDLAPLLANRARSGSVSPAFAPRRVVQHHATPGQAVTALSFSSSGSMLAVSGADGVYVRVFEVRPKGRYSKGGPRLAAQDDPSPLEGRDTGSLWHWYDLQRGVTRRRVTSIIWSADSKWVGVVTVRGTIHVFAVNPYGGPPTGASHLLGSGRVVNMSEPQRAPVSLSSVIRLHSSGTSTPPAGGKPSPGTPVSAAFGRPSKPSRDSGAQDVLVFNHRTGELLLKQCVVRMQPASTLERGMQGVQASISLPGGLSNSGLSTLSGNGMSALSNMMRGMNTPNTTGGSVDNGAGALVLGGVEGAGQTWGAVVRELEWGEVRGSLLNVGVGKDGKAAANPGRSEWLAQAEITTCTRSTKLLSGPIYLSHQFVFMGLCLDWQALLQQSHLSLPATKIVVRREVSARAIAQTGSDGAFLGSGAEDTFVASSSLDAPLASALTGSISPESASQQIPSYPNAYSGGRGTSWKDPVKRLSHLSDGIGQGLGSFRREIGRVERRVRSPTSPTAPVMPGIKLEFDDNDALFEADEDLPPREGEGVAGLRASREDDGSRSAESNTGSVPSTVPDMPPIATPDLDDWVGDGGLSGEEAEYSRAREEDSRFDDLVGEWRVAGAGWSRSVDHGAGSDLDDDVVAFDVRGVGVYDGGDGAVGFMDEEEEERRVALEAGTPVSRKKHRKKR
ncbi:hypothetical protein FRC10_004951 [Ceratobasidium sp. 414]|nr:hypothetical protein FRC10_004951 [Ceratobasidium sp. 414]